MTRRARPTRRTFSMGLTLWLLLFLAGCGNDNADEGDSKDSIDTNYAEKALTQAEFMSSVHAAAAKEGTAHVTLVMTAARAIKAAGDVAFDSGGTRMNVTMQSGDHQLAMRLVDNQCFLQMSGVTPPGKFVVVDPNDKSESLAQTCAILTDQMVPLVDLKTMNSAVRKVERVGQQKMDGVKVEEYKVTVDTASILSGRGSRADAVKLPGTIEYHYWIDENNLTHRRFYKAPDIDFDARVTRWGDPVEILRPPNGRVLAMPKT